MSDKEIELTRKLLCEKEASRVYGMSIYWFRRKRVEGDGPAFIKIGRSVRYSIDDLEAFFSPPE